MNNQIMNKYHGIRVIESINISLATDDRWPNLYERYTMKFLSKLSTKYASFRGNLMCTHAKCDLKRALYITCTHRTINTVRK
jgi:hypothetical protein